MHASRVEEGASSTSDVHVAFVMDVSGDALSEDASVVGARRVSRLEAMIHAVRAIAADVNASGVAVVLTDPTIVSRRLDDDYAESERLDGLTSSSSSSRGRRSHGGAGRNAGRCGALVPLTRDGEALEAALTGLERSLGLVSADGGTPIDAPRPPPGASFAAALSLAAMTLAQGGLGLSKGSSRREGGGGGGGGEGEAIPRREVVIVLASDPPLRALRADVLRPSLARLHRLGARRRVLRFVHPAAETATEAVKDALEAVTLCPVDSDCLAPGLACDACGTCRVFSPSTRLTHAALAAARCIATRPTDERARRWRRIFPNLPAFPTSDADEPAKSGNTAEERERNVEPRDDDDHAGRSRGETETGRTRLARAGYGPGLEGGDASPAKTTGRSSSSAPRHGSVEGGGDAVDDGSPGACRSQHALNDAPEEALARAAARLPPSKFRVLVDVAATVIAADDESDAESDDSDDADAEAGADREPEPETVPSRQTLALKRVPVTIEADILARTMHVLTHPIAEVRAGRLLQCHGARPGRMDGPVRLTPDSRTRGVGGRLRLWLGVDGGLTLQYERLRPAPSREVIARLTPERAKRFRSEAARHRAGISDGSPAPDTAGRPEMGHPLSNDKSKRGFFLTLGSGAGKRRYFYWLQHPDFDEGVAALRSLTTHLRDPPTLASATGATDAQLSSLALASPTLLQAFSEEGGGLHALDLPVGVSMGRVFAGLAETLPKAVSDAASNVLSDGSGDGDGARLAALGERHRRSPMSVRRGCAGVCTRPAADQRPSKSSHAAPGRRTLPVSASPSHPRSTWRVPIGCSSVAAGGHVGGRSATSLDASQSTTSSASPTPARVQSGRATSTVGAVHAATPDARAHPHRSIAAFHATEGDADETPEKDARGEEEDDEIFVVDIDLSLVAPPAAKDPTSPPRGDDDGIDDHGGKGTVPSRHGRMVGRDGDSRGGEGGMPREAGVAVTASNILEMFAAFEGGSDSREPPPNPA